MSFEMISNEEESDLVVGVGKPPASKILVQ